MTNFARRTAVALTLTLTLVGALGSPAGAQPPKERPKEVTDGFFDVPARESEPAWGLPEYLVTTGLGGLAIFLVCKSARRNG